MEEDGVGRADHPFLAKGIGVFNDGLSITGNHLTAGVGSEHSSTAIEGIDGSGRDNDLVELLEGLNGNGVALSNIEARLGLVIVDSAKVNRVVAEVSIASLDMVAFLLSIEPECSAVLAGDLQLVLAELNDGCLNVRPPCLDLRMIKKSNGRCAVVRLLEYETSAIEVFAVGLTLVRT